MIVYLAQNVKNGKSYVGKTKRSLEQRKKEHVTFANKGARQPFYYAIRKHGIEAFEWRVLVDVDCTHDELNALERKFIEQFGSFGSKGYNATSGGDGVTGWSPSPEHRERVRQALLGEKNHNFGVAWGRTGPLTEEAKRKISAKNSGRKHTLEAREKISASQYLSVEQLDMTGRLVATYDSMLQAAEKTKCQRTNISRACRFPERSCGGYRWRYTQKEKGTAWAF